MDNSIYQRIVESIYLFTCIGIIIGCKWGCNYIKNKFEIREDEIIRIAFIPAIFPILLFSLIFNVSVVFYLGFFVILFSINKFLKKSTVVINN